MRKIVARIHKEFLVKYPKHDSYFPQKYCNRIPMPVVKYPRGIPAIDETCAILITKEERWFYHRLHAARKAAKVSPADLPKPAENYGTRIVVRIYRLDPPAKQPAAFELRCWQSDGKATRMKHIPHDEPPPDCE